MRFSYFTAAIRHAGGVAATRRVASANTAKRAEVFANIVAVGRMDALKVP